MTNAAKRRSEGGFAASTAVAKLHLQATKISRVMNRAWTHVSLFSFAIAVFGCGGGADRTPTLDVDRVWTLAERQLAKSVEALPVSQQARSTASDGRWTSVGAGDWTSGFHAGCLWLTYEKTNQAEWRTRAEARTAVLESQKNNTSDHDVGFRLLTSYGNGLRLTGNAAYRAVLLDGARSLATRFDPEVGCTRSWSFGAWKFPVIVDNMMNLELLLWAAENGGDPAWRDMAVSHALKTLQNHV